MVGSTNTGNWRGKLALAAAAVACAGVAATLYRRCKVRAETPATIRTSSTAAESEASVRASTLAAHPPAPVASEERSRGLELFNQLKAKANESFQRGQLDDALAGYQDAADCLHAMGLDSETLVFYQTIQANAALVMNKQNRFDDAINVTSFMLEHPAPMPKDLHVKVLYRRAIARKGKGDLVGAKADLKEALMFSDGHNPEVQKEIEKVEAMIHAA